MKAFAACVVALASSAIAAPAPAVILDQQQELANGGFTLAERRPYAQTFTPAISGQLDHVDLWLCGGVWPEPFTATISVVKTINGKPTGSVLSSVRLPPLVVDWHWYSISFLDTPLTLDADSLYAILMTSDASEAWMAVAAQWEGDVYPRGALWNHDSSTGWQLAGFASFPAPGSGEADMAFRTYMVPEPTMMMLLTVTGLGAIGLRRRRPAPACG